MGISRQCVAVHSHEFKVVIVTQIDFLWFPTANVFVAFGTNFLADQNVMSCVRGDLTPHFEHKTFARHSLWNMNLN